ncbi:MAG: DUF1549 domain-containing protein [Fuerstiella sp.]
MSGAVLAGLIVILTLAFRQPPASGQTPQVNFDTDVAPILIDHCLDCHSGAEPKGGLDLSARELAFRGGESGVALVAGEPEASALWQRVASAEMPPKKALTEVQQQTLHRWIAGGAKWGTSPIDPTLVTTQHRAGRDWWALQPVRRPLVPEIASESAVRNPIDAFVLQRLHSRELSASEQATPQVLVRRLFFDLVGLPPSPDDVARFEAAGRLDPATAVSELVNTLLASRHFGERWGRHWLDVVRFGESQGFERDKLRPDSWYYRDWVINAINDDMPYDEFVRLQIAGDVLRPDDPNAITATGFLVAGPWDEVGQNMRGRLNRQYGGPPYRDFETFVSNTQFYKTIDPDTPDAHRRTVYRTWVRSGRHPLLDVFDCPDPSTTAPQRAVTTTPLQSLALMNNSFVLRMADRFAERVTADVGDNREVRIRRVFQLAYGRAPHEAEIRRVSRFLTKHNLASLCRVIFNSNEFIHVD